MWDLSSRPKIKPEPPAVEVESLNHWTTREIPVVILFQTIKAIRKGNIREYIHAEVG